MIALLEPITEKKTARAYMDEAAAKEKAAKEAAKAAKAAEDLASGGGGAIEVS